MSVRTYFAGWTGVAVMQWSCVPLMEISYNGENYLVAIEHAMHHVLQLYVTQYYITVA